MNANPPSPSMNQEETPRTVRVLAPRPYGSGQRIGWTKVVHNVIPGVNNGYAFDGQFIDDHQADLPLGAVIVGRFPVGSAKNGTMHWRIGRVTEDGIEWDPQSWAPRTFLDFRDQVAATLQQFNAEHPQP